MTSLAPALKSILAWCKTHSVALGVSLLGTLAIATLPHWLFIPQMHAPIWLADHDEMFYLSIASQAYFNHPWTLAEPMLASSLENPYPSLQLVPAIVLAQLLGLGPLLIGLLWRASGALMIGLCYYLFAFRITRLRSAAACLAVWIASDVGVPSSLPIVRQAQLTVKLLSGQGQELLLTYPQIQPSWRVITPTLSLGYLLLFLLLLSRALDRPSWPRRIGAGLACSLLFYDYFYFITAAGLGLILALLFMPKQRLTLLVVGVIGFIGGLPHTIELLFLRSSSSSDWLQRWDMFVPIPRFSELLIPRAAIALSLICLAWCLLRARRLLYLWFTAAAALLLLNHQVVSELQIQNYHWLYVIGPVHILLLAALLWQELERWPNGPRYASRVLLVVTPLIFASGLWLRSVEARRTAESRDLMFELSSYQRWRFSAEGLTRPLQANAVIAGDQDVLDWASILENQRPLTHYTVLSSPSIDDRNWDERVALGTYLQGVDRAAFIALQQRDLAINAPRSAAVREQRLAGRLAAYDQICLDPKAMLAKLKVRYVAAKADAPLQEVVAKTGLRLYQGGKLWQLWQMP